MQTCNPSTHSTFIAVGISGGVDVKIDPAGADLRLKDCSHVQPCTSVCLTLAYYVCSVYVIKLRNSTKMSR